MKRILSLIAVAAIAVTAAPALAQTATFVNTWDEFQWGFNEIWSLTGGNPDGYHKTEFYFDFAARYTTRTNTGSFTGDFRARRVTSVGIDMITEGWATTADRPLTLILRYFNGTPDDPFDDTSAYFMGPNMPAFGEGWVSYDYEVPSQETELPDGWLLLNNGDLGSPPVHDWDTIIQNVDQLEFFGGDPTYFFIFQQWDMGADNVRISLDPPASCPGNSGDSNFQNSVVQ